MDIVLHSSVVFSGFKKGDHSSLINNLIIILTVKSELTGRRRIGAWKINLEKNRHQHSITFKLTETENERIYARERKRNGPTVRWEA